MRAVVVDPDAPGRLVIRDVEEPTPGPSEAIVRVHSVSLNRGESRGALLWAEAGVRPGWDLAGIVEQAAVDGSGPPVGARVVGLVRTGSWAERVAVPTDALAELPENLTCAQASTLPVAGLTALHALYKRGTLLDRKVLLTGATGGVGSYGIQLAKLAGAHLTAHVRRAEQEALIRAWGAETVAVGEDLATAAKPFGPFDLVLESVGGDALPQALQLLAPDGLCVSYGTSAGYTVTYDAADFFMLGGASLYGLSLFHELPRVESAAIGLERLARMVSTGKLTPHIEVEAPWEKVAEVAQGLVNRKFVGKAVLHVAKE
jgi:NADPH:quinone reductase-like Zn-dependent oxidoreductase